MNVFPLTYQRLGTLITCYGFKTPFLYYKGYLYFTRSGPDVADMTNPRFRILTELGQKLVTNLFKIPQIQEVGVGGFVFFVSRSESVDDQSEHEQVRSALNEASGDWATIELVKMGGMKEITT